MSRLWKQGLTHTPPFHKQRTKMGGGDNFPSTFSLSLSQTYSQKLFHGASIDTGAARNVCGYGQAFTYCDVTNKRLTLRSSNAVFQFGNHLYYSKGTLRVRSLSGNGRFISFQVVVVNADVPLLIWLKNLKSNGILLNYLEECLEHQPYGYAISVTYKHGHSFIEKELH